MRIIKQYNINQEITSESSYSFTLEQSGVFFIEITARTRSWWQNTKQGRAFLHKDALSVAVDSKELTQGRSPRKKYSGIFSWNGNLLKDSFQTILIVKKASSGPHTLSLKPHQKPYVHSLKIFTLSGGVFFTYQPLAILSSQARDRAPLLVVVAEDVFLNTFLVRARAEKHKGDDDDLGIVVNGARIMNDVSRSHREWFWCGKILNGASRLFEQEHILPQHHKVLIELWADRAPEIEEFSFTISDETEQDEIHPNTQSGRVIWKELAFREEPSADSTVIQRLKKGEFFELIERAIAGDTPKNESGVYLGSDRWHKVRFGKKEGYIFSQGAELDGEDPRTVRNIIIERARLFEIDPCLLSAIAEQESKFSPYATSKKKAHGVFQLRVEAIQDVNRVYKKQFKDRFSLLENIDAGILYFKHLNDFYHESDHSLERALTAWNWGMGRISKTEPFSLAALPRESRDFIRFVLKKRTRCRGEQQKTGVVNSRLAIFALLFFSISIVGIYVRSEIFVYDNSNTTKPLNLKDTQEIIEERVVDFDGDGRRDRFILVFAPDSYIHYSLYYQNARESAPLFHHDSDGILSWLLGDVNENQQPDILVHDGYSGSAGFGTLTIYELDGGSLRKIFERSEVEGTYSFFNRYSRDNKNELTFFYKERKWDSDFSEAIYRWNNEKNVYELITDKTGTGAGF